MINFNNNKLLRMFVLTIGITTSFDAYGADDSDYEILITGKKSNNAEMIPQTTTSTPENSAQVEQLRLLFI